jgi:hypothetical protein
VVFRNIEIELIVQLDLDGALRASANADVKVLFILNIRIGVTFEKYEDNWMAEFQGEIKLNIGIGTITAGVIASVSVGEYTITEQDRIRMLHSKASNHTESEGASRELALGSFKDADWDLEFYSDWETAQWVEDLGELIYEGLLEIYKVLAEAWDALVKFVEETWNAITNLAKAIGGAIADFFEGISQAIEEIGKFVDDGVDYVVAAFDGVGLDGLGDILEIGADFVIGSGLRQLSSLTDAGEKMANGDVLEGLGDAIVSLVYSKYKDNQKTVTLKNEDGTVKEDETYSCPLLRTCKF